MSDRFLWESSIEEVDLFAHCFSGNTIIVSSERNDSSVLENNVEIIEGFVEVHASESSSCLVSVLVMNSQVISSAHSS